jgi:transcription-repair coupling factor (superfamily II helicase)
VAAARVLARVHGPLAIVTDDSHAASDLYEALPVYQEILGDSRPLVQVPEVVRARNQWVPENEAGVCAALDAAANTRDPVIFLVSALAGTAPTLPPTEFAEGSFVLRAGDDELGPEALCQRLVDLDYDHEIEVHVPGEFARRGGIVDVFSPVDDAPVRIEYFGNTVDTMRRFDPDTQRSFEPVQELRVVPRGASVLMPSPEQTRCFWDFLSASVPLVIVEPEAVVEHLRRYGEGDDVDRWEQARTRRPSVVTLETRLTDDLNGDGLPSGAESALDCVLLSDLFPQPSAPLSAENRARQWEHMLTHLRAWHGEGQTIVAFCGTPGEATRFQERLDQDPELRSLCSGVEPVPLSSGIRLPGAGLVLLSERELFGRSPGPQRRRRSKYRIDHALHEESELEEGAFVVHAVHGICRFHGIRSLEERGTVREAMDLEFEDDARLLLPLDQAHLVSRYIGGTRARPKLSRLGGSAWKRKTAAATDAAYDLAAELLRLEAMRTHSPGFEFRADAVWEQAFAQSFPYTETEDQAQAITEVLAEMGQETPMDRLLCGDVGYGKTEVAMRAAFRAVVNSKQVAVLVPTTVLAQQHYMTFCERMAEYPVTIELLNRFRTASEQKDVTQRLAEGRVDIVIGTHRLLSDDIVFHDLGLLVIDEEQRFGVQHNEKFKHLRSSVDVLTMTATPIPRTLYFSLSGLRHLSTIMTPPAERLPVTTVVAAYDRNLVRTAILRELERRGQTFYLHNRVQSIERVCHTLCKLVPEARFAVAHGQLAGHELEAVMTRFVRREIDVLVCTTIIESGLDIPNANTIIIDRADRFGLAELYQLRGRVGRYHNQAYAYLLLPPMGALPANARERIAAIRRYTHLGAGFRLALKDLEIRGAGNILGSEQSGHIAAVGFELYCKLLKQAAEHLQTRDQRRPPAQPDVTLDFVLYGIPAAGERLAAALPPDYIQDQSVRIQQYRRVAEAMSADTVHDLAEEFADRFGPLPAPAQTLLRLAEIRVAAAEAGVHSVRVRDQAVFLEGRSGLVRNPNSQVPRLTAATPTARLTELLELVTRLGT